MDFDNIDHLPVADGEEDIGNVASYRLQREYPAEAEQLDGDAFRRLIHNTAISEFPKGRKYLISLSFRGKASVRPAQVGGFDVNIVIHGSTAVRGRGDLVAYRWALWKLTAPWTHRTRPPHLGKRCAFSTSSTGPFPSNHSRKTPKGPKIALGNPDRPHNMHRYESLTAAKELFRRGLVFYRNHAYFCAFVHFIFTVESFYADGKTGKAAVIKAFKKSAEFGRIIGYVLTEMPSRATGRGVMQLVKKAGCQWTTDGIMEFLYDERGRLLHYFKATNRFNPFTEDAHQPVAFLAMSVGCHAILQKTVAINQTNPAQPENQVTAAPSLPTAAPRRHAQPRRSGIEYHRVVLRERVSPSRVAELIHDWRPYNKEKAADSYGYVGSVLDYPESDDNIALAIVPSATADRTRHPVLELFCKVGDARYMRSVSTLAHAQVSFPNDGRLLVFQTGSNEIIVSSELLSEKVVIDLLRFGCNFAR